MPAKKQTNFRLPDATLKQLAELCEKTGMTQTQVLLLAIDKLHTEKLKRG